MLTDRFGLSVHQHLGAWPSRDEQIRLGVKVLRVLVVDQDRLLGQLDNDLAPGVNVIALINSQTPGVNHPPVPGNTDGLLGWVAAIIDFANRFSGKVFAVECLNEWDINPQLSVDDAVRCVVDASQILRAAGIKCLLGSVVGAGLEDKLRQALGKLEEQGARGLLDGVCTHPYLRPAMGVPDPEPDTGAWFSPEIHEAIQSAFDAVNPEGSDPVLPVYATEYGLPMSLNPDDDGSLQEQFVRNSLRVLGTLPEDVLGAACYFSYSDRSGGGPNEVFGLVRGDRSPRLGLDAFLGEAVQPVVA